MELSLKAQFYRQTRAPTRDDSASSPLTPRTAAAWGSGLIFRGPVAHRPEWRCRLCRREQRTSTISLDRGGGNRESQPYRASAARPANRSGLRRVTPVRADSITPGRLLHLKVNYLRLASLGHRDRQLSSSGPTARGALCHT